MASTVHGWYRNFQIRREIFAPCVMICLLEKHAFNPETQKIATFSGFAVTLNFLIQSL